MKPSTPMFVVCTLAMAAIATADSGVQQPAGVMATNLEYLDYYGQDSPTPAEPAPAAQAKEKSADAVSPSCGCGDICDTCAPCNDCCDPCCDGCCRGCLLRDHLPEGHPCFGWRLPSRHCGEWKLFTPCCDQWTVGGWINGGVTTNSHGAPQNGALPFLSSNDLLLNQLWGYIGRETDTGGYGWDLGVRLDYIFGADGLDTQALGDLGWDFGWNSGGQNIPSQTYGSAIPQLYLEVAYNDLKVRLGRFYTIIGYEVVQAPGNFFYTHAYTMYYGEPFTHTGALGEWAYSDDTALYGGYVAGWDTGWENLIDANMFIGGIKLAWWEDATLTYALVAGDRGTRDFAGGPPGPGNQYMHSIVLEYQLTDAWKYVFQSDLSLVTDRSTASFAESDAQWYGINQYLFYDINESWQAGFRFEWWSDEDAGRINALGLGEGDFYAVTAGLNWKPTDNLVIRPEIRYDRFHSRDGNPTRPFDGGIPFANGVEKDQFSFAVDGILKF